MDVRPQDQAWSEGYGASPHVMQARGRYHSAQRAVKSTRCPIGGVTPNGWELSDERAARLRCSHGLGDRHIFVSRLTE